MGIRTYKITDAAGVLQYRAVVQDGEGAVKKPAAENEGKFVGITLEAQANQNKSVTVKDSGRSFAVAGDAIAAGDAVNIHDATGKVQSCEADYALGAGVAKQIYCIGFARTHADADGDIIELEIMPHQVKTAAS